MFTVLKLGPYSTAISVADPSIGVGRRAGHPPRPSDENVSPLDVNSELYMNYCHRDPVNIFFI